MELYIYEEDSDEWVEELLEDDEVRDWEAGFIKGYKEAQDEGFK